MFVTTELTTSTSVLLTFLTAGCCCVIALLLALALLRRQLNELHRSIDILNAKLHDQSSPSYINQEHQHDSINNDSNDNVAKMMDELRTKLESSQESQGKRLDQISVNVARLIDTLESTSRRDSRYSRDSIGSRYLRDSFSSTATSLFPVPVSPPLTPIRTSKVLVKDPASPDSMGGGSGGSEGGSLSGGRHSHRFSLAHQDSQVGGQYLLTRHIEVGNFIGEGAFGAVHKGRWRGVPVALKFLHSDDERMIENLSREAAVLHEIDHPRVMRLYGVCTDDAELPANWPTKRYPNLRPPMLVCELMTEGNFVDFLLASAPHREEKSKHWRRIAEMLEGAASGLEYLHSHGVVHRDLKALNLFVDGRGRLKIGDFGLAKMYAPNFHSRRLSDDTWFQRDTSDNSEESEPPAFGKSPGSVTIGTWTHQAPELMSSELKDGPVKYTRAVDIFSFAIVIIEALGANAAEELVDTTRVEVRRGKGETPLFGIDIRGVRALLHEEWHCAETNALLKLVASCGSLEPTMRPTAKQLRSELNRVRLASVHLELQVKKGRTRLSATDMTPQRGSLAST